MIATIFVVGAWARPIALIVVVVEGWDAFSTWVVMSKIV